MSSYPAEVTSAMVTTFLAQKACVNAFARAVDIDVRVVDAGVASELSAPPRLIDAKVRKGTRNAAKEPALTLHKSRTSLDEGEELVGKAIDEGADAIAVGEMGIGNTASSALLMHRLAPAPLESCVGRGAGHDEAGLERKIAVLRRAAARSSRIDSAGHVMRIWRVRNRNDGRRDVGDGGASAAGRHRWLHLDGRRPSRHSNAAGL